LIQVTRSENQYRFYDNEDVNRLRQIKQLRELGISLADIRLWCENILTVEEIIRKRLRTLADDDIKSRNCKSLCEFFLKEGFLIPENSDNDIFQEPETSSAEECPTDLPLFFGIDIGTTSISAQVVASNDGHCIETYSFDHNSGITAADYPDAYAADAERLIERALALVNAVTKTYPNIVSIGITGQMHGIVCLDKDRNILTPLYTWQNEFGLRQISDTDSRTVCQVIKDRCGENIPTGYGIVTYYALREFGLLPKQTTKIATIMDVLAGRLCGTEPVIHPTNAASLGFYNLADNTFRKNLIEMLDIPFGVLPKITDDYASVGIYSAGERKIPVSVGIGDNQAGLFGSLAGNDMVLINVGTSSQVSLICDTPIECGGEIRPYFDGKYIASGAALCGGRAYAMLCGIFRSAAKAFGVEVSSHSVYEYLNHAAESAADTDLIVSTQFCGTRADSSVRGSITNIGPNNFTPESLAYGFLNGIADELYHMYTAINPSGAQNTPVISGNALRRNPALRKICTKYFGFPLHMPFHTEEAAFGAALYGAVACKLLTREESYKRIRYDIND